MLQFVVKTVKANLSPKYRLFFKRFKDRKFTLLDVGCGNHSPTRAKYFFPNVEYYGVDKDVYNNDEQDLKHMKTFYKKDLEHDSLGDVPDDFFDVIIFCHVIEHLENGLCVVERLIKKMKKGGHIYIEFPSIKSLSLPSMNGTLNFCDDTTHKRLYDLKEVANVLLHNNCKIIRGGVRRNFWGIVLVPITLLNAWIKGLAPASALWDIFGFAEYIHGQRV
jgi:SAM-dependent methyltransferase